MVPQKFEMRDHCKERGFEGLLGYLDVNVLAFYDREQGFVPLDEDLEEKHWAYPVCSLVPAPKDVV